MTEYRYTRISLIVDCLTSCWHDLYTLCRDWNTSAEQLSDTERLTAETLYMELDLNRNARRLNDLTSGVNLLAETQQGQYSVEMMSSVLTEIERIDSRIDNWFAKVQSSDDGPVNPYLAQDIYLIRDAMVNVQYIFDPLVIPTPGPISMTPAPEQPPVARAKPRRIYPEAIEKRERLLNMYNNYIKKGYSANSAVQALVHDFKHEYCPQKAQNRKKVIKKIIRDWNNKE